ncbi:MAG: tetratricopeptide repeat protein [Deltaproteobacteria bacterium]|nr:tetratricopeptide repeat protein [Candidatus Tharpella aukensis]
MSKGKISVRRELREPDAFIKTTYTALDYIKKHLKLISIAAVILVAVAATATGAYWYTSDRNQSAQQLLNQVLITLANQPTETEIGNSQQLETILSSYKNTVAQPVAGYLSANRKYRAGDLSGATEIYQNNSKVADRHLRDLERLGLAVIHFQQKEYTEAISILERMQTEQSFINEDLYLLLGLSYEKNRQPEKAVATYENMIQLLQNSFFKPWAQERLLSLKNAANS